MNNILKGILKFIAFPIFFWIGLISFFVTHKTNKLSYISFRYLFVLTDGKINSFISNAISLFSKPIEEEIDGILGKLSQNELNEVIESIKKNGYFEFDMRLKEDDLNALLVFARSTSTKCINIEKKGVEYFNEKIIFDENNPVSPRYQFDSTEVVQNNIARKIIFDAGFRQIASKYLNCKPILDIVTMWWSVPFQKKGTSQAAQMFHFDMDRFKFIKFFIYLTDVDTNNGPHCYIKNSHNGIPREVRKDRRLDDLELEKHYPKENFKEFIGSKGSILAVDTRGLHKGKPLTKGQRLLFQIQFSNSLFGAPFETMKISNPTTKEKDIMNQHKRTYKLMV